MSNSDEGGKDCPPILDENIEIEVIRPGKDANGDTSSNGRGSVLKVNCASGYELNLPKRKVQKLRNCFKQLDTIHNALRGDLTSTFRRIHMGWLF